MEMRESEMVLNSRRARGAGHPRKDVFGDASLANRTIEGEKQGAWTRREYAKNQREEKE